MILFLFRSHIYRKHRDSQELRDQDMPSYCGDEPDDVNYNEITVLDDVISTSGQSSKVEDQRRAALFILKAKEERMLTQNALEGLLDDITGIDMFSLFVHAESKYSIMFHA